VALVAGDRVSGDAAIDEGAIDEGAGGRAQWWLATLGRNVVWARLRVREAGTAEIFDADGNTLSYDSEDTARAALMDAEFVEYEGLDADDALERGFRLDEVEPPAADSDEGLRPLMFKTLGGSA
jgi:hypothetical protein